MSTCDPRTPVLIGCGQVNISGGGSPEPIDLMVEAARLAGADAGVPRAVDSIESVRVVRTLSRAYPDPGALVAERLGLGRTHTTYSTVGGNIPQLLVNRSAADIAAGRADLIVICGAEAWKTRSKARASGALLDWTEQDPRCRPDDSFGQGKDFSNDVERQLGLGEPVVAYPLFEVAHRHLRGWTVDEHRAVMGSLWSRFSSAAASNPYAAIRRSVTPEDLVTAAPGNRMISYPYTKLLCSNNSVDQAAALLMCSADKARSLGVPADRWVFLHGSAEGDDTDHISNRADLGRSAAIRQVGAATLETARISVDDLRYIDLYSCFPSAVLIAAHELGIELDRDLTVTGGLTFAGGPWNNYVSHSIATMMGILRESPEDFGLCTANGGLLTKHAAAVYSCRPTDASARWRSVQNDLDLAPRLELTIDSSFDGVIEAYTVVHDRDGSPTRAVISVIPQAGQRAWGHTTDDLDMSALIEDDLCGHRVHLDDGVATLGP